MIAAMAALRHTAEGFWLEEAGAAELESQPPLSGSHDVDVAVVGGGYTGLWTAWHLLQREPGARVAVLEGARCGHGPSGRNGGFAEDYWYGIARAREQLGAGPALSLARAAEESVRAIGSWCEEQQVDAWFRPGGYLAVSTAPAQDETGLASMRACRELGVPEKVTALDQAGLRARCDSPVFRRGAFVPSFATVQPARLVLGLRRRLVEAGALVYEHTRARRLRGGTIETEGGRLRAGAVVLAGNAALAGFGPLRGRLTVASSHMVLTEPVPDVLEQVGWTGGECITDGRTLLHYLRTTPDGRIAFGWAGGRLAFGARLGGRVEVDGAIVAQARRDLARMFPALSGRAITHAWGGPIDVSPGRLPVVGSLPGDRVHYAYGFTGNGVGPSHLAARVLSSLALGRRDPETQLALGPPHGARVPPEPLRWLGGSVVRAALLRKESLEERSLPVDPVTRTVCALPRRMGITLGR